MKKIWGLFSVLVILIALPLAVFFSQNKTSYQQQANENIDLRGLMRDLTPDGTEDAVMQRFSQRYQGIRGRWLSNMYKICRKNDTPKKCKFQLFTVISPTIAQETTAPTDEPTPEIQEEQQEIVQEEVTTNASSPSQTASGPMTLIVSLCPHGIGNCGDSVSQSGGNTHPVQTTRPITFTLFNSSNQAVGTFSTNAVYNESKQQFSATITTGLLPGGSYMGKVQMSGYLAAWTPGILTLTPGQQHLLPLIELVTGDINRDNTLNNQDFNLFMQCFKDKTCPQSQQLASDLDNNGAVEAIDYNLLLRELGTKTGVN